MFRSQRSDSRSHRRREGLTFEALEKKKLLAGDVTVVFDDATGDLTISGDNRSNFVTIVQDVDDGTITIKGKGGTEINGESSIEIEGPLNNVTVNLQEGNDKLKIVRAVFNNLDIDDSVTDRGNDRTQLRNVSAKGDVTIDTGAGNDAVRFSGLFAGDIAINTGTGNDFVLGLGQVGVELDDEGNLDPDYTFGGSTGGDSALTVETDGGRDGISLIGLDVDGTVDLRTGDDIDAIGLWDVRIADRIDVFAGTGTDFVWVADVETPVMDIRLGGGDDFYFQKNGILPTSRSLDGGDGFDRAYLNGGPADVIVNVERIRS